MKISSKWIALLAVSALSLVALTGSLRPVVVRAPTTQSNVDKVAVSAVSLTPITSLSQSSSNCPEALGGSCNVAGGLYADTVRIDIYARTGSSTATLNLIEYYRDDSRWVIHGADCSVTTALTLCRYVTKRGNRHWHVYKSAGTMAYVAIDEVSGPIGGTGTIEPAPTSGAGTGSVTSVAMSVPSILSITGSPITTSGTLAVSLATQSANLHFVGPSSGGAATPTFRALVPADLASGADNGEVLTVSSGVLAWGAAGGTSAAFFCDGADGSATITGGTTTLATSRCYTTLLVEGTGVLRGAGFQVFATTSITVDASGVIHNDGNDASGATNGAGASLTAMSNQFAGGAGQTGAGSNGSNQTTCGGGGGGAGGAGSGGAGGNGGTCTAPTANTGAWRAYPYAMNWHYWGNNAQSYVKAGTGGGGGGGNGAQAGGGGGSSAGALVVAAPTIVNNGRISTIGGAGAAGTASNCGGGAGGGGGLLTALYRSLTGNTPTVAGGTGGASGGGTGSAGSAGNAGNYEGLGL